ncbi:MAG: hypothetical protein QW273_02975 [Candidatus Pacearchaeota archaeon]
MQERNNVLRILKESLSAITSNNPEKLISLSNQTIHSAAIFQDPDNIIVAVLIYSLGKIFERESYKNKEGWDSFYQECISELKNAIYFLEKEDLEKFRSSLGKIRESANKIEGELREYIQDIFYKAQINKAFKIYEHGISSERTAKLLGISLWDLSSFIGQSNVYEAHLYEKVSIKERIKLLEEFLK